MVVCTAVPSSRSDLSVRSGLASGKAAVGVHLDQDLADFVDGQVGEAGRQRGVQPFQVGNSWGFIAQFSDGIDGRLTD